MNTKVKQGFLVVMALAAGLLVAGVAGAVNYNSVSSGHPSKSRLNSVVSAGQPIRLEEKGVKTFEVFNYTTPALVVDENGTAPTSGCLSGVALSSSAAVGDCAIVVLDTSTANAQDFTTVGHALIPPVLSVSSAPTFVNFTYCRQFNQGLVVYMNNSQCKGYVYWKRNGGAD